jgi:hypothetical protein
MRQRNPSFGEEQTSFFQFKGIRNTVSYRDRDLGGLVVGRNVEVTPTNKLQRRAGFSSFAAGPFVGLFATADQRRMYAVTTGGNLVRVDRDGATTVLANGYTTAYYRWAEAPDRAVYFTDGSSSGVISPAHDVLPLVVARPPVPVVELVQSLVHVPAPLNIGRTYDETVMSVCATYSTADGREGPASDIATVVVSPEVSRLRVTVPTEQAVTTIYCTAPGGTEYFEVASGAQASFLVPTAYLYGQAVRSQPPLGLQPFPAATHICFHQGQLYAGMYDSQRQLSALYLSQVSGWHLFDMARDFLTVDGELRLLLSTPKGMVIGTSTAVYGWVDGSLTPLCDYGVVAGRPGAVSADGTAYFWTLRGACKAFPFEAITEPYFSGDPGVQNYSSLVQREGFTRFIASTITGEPAYNPRTER